MKTMKTVERKGMALVEVSQRAYIIVEVLLQFLYKFTLSSFVSSARGQAIKRKSQEYGIERKAIPSNTL